MRRQVCYFMVLATAALMAAALNADTISINLAGTDGNVMTSEDLAGAPDVRVGNWNNYAAVPLGDDEEVLYDDGRVVGGDFQVVVTLNGGSAFSDRSHPAGNYQNDPQMFRNVIDERGGDTNPSRSVVTNIPFETYDVYVYLLGDLGGMRIGETTYYLRSAARPDSNGNGYVQATSEVRGTASTDFEEGNYVVFEGVQGDSFTLETFGIRPSDGTIARLKWSGFQIVESAPRKVEPAAPQKDAVNVEIDQDLMWTVNDPNVAFIDLYFGTEDDPNLSIKPEYLKLSVEPSSTVTYDPGMLGYKTTYFWRIDTYEPNLAPGAMDYVLTPGVAWSFTTVAETPSVSPVDPAFTAVEAGADAVLSVTAANADSYQWYRIGETVDEMLLEGNGYAGVNTDTLAIYDVQLADEGIYYCAVANSAATVSNRETGFGRLMTRRLTSHYTFETLTDGVTPDAADGYQLTVLSDDAGTDLPVLSAGLPELAPETSSLLFDNSDSADPNYWGQYAMADAGVVDYEDITISAWVYWNGGANWQRLFDFGNDTNHYMFLTLNQGSQCRFVLRNGGGEQIIGISPLPTNQWVFVTATLGGNTGRLYVNGELRGTNTGMSINPIDFRAQLNYVGKSQYPDPYFNGRIDDLKIYNYARTTEQVAQDYLALRGEWVCNGELPANPYDFNDDCRVDLGDFAILAAEWLESNRIYPAF